MTSGQKQSALNRHRAIVMATLDYLIEHYGGIIVHDQIDPVTEYYLQQKVQTEKYYKQRRLDRLEQRLDRLTKMLQNGTDLSFADYIKAQTGYDFDIFEGLQNRVEAVIAQKEIRNREEQNDLIAMLSYYKHTSADKEKIGKLKALLFDYSKPAPKSATAVRSGKRATGYSEVISKVEKDGIEKVTIRFSTGPQPVHLKEQETISPDGKRRLVLTEWSNGKRASTCVLLIFPAASGTVLRTNGIRPDIKASWKDNSTILIETKKDCPVNMQHKEVRSFNDVISIEYVEY